MKLFYRKFLPLFLILGFAFNAMATNDTLTRAQVYNFNVGDSFEYRHYFKPLGTYSITSYYWKVVESISHSSNGDTLFINYNLGNNYDLALTDLQQYEWNTGRSSSYSSLNYCTVDTHSSYNGRITNDVWPNEIFEGFVHEIYGEGLGQILHDFQGWGDYFVQDATTLIYYRKGAEVWGTQVLLGNVFNDIEETTKISFHLSPNPASDEITITTEARNGAALDAYVYDITGNCVATHKNISANLQNIKVFSLPPGYYFLKVTDEHANAAVRSFIVAR